MANILLTSTACFEQRLMSNIQMVVFATEVPGKFEILPQMR